MESYGRIKADGSLSQSSKLLDGYKPIQFDKLPESFDQETQYATQKQPIENGDHIFVGIELHELEIEDEEFEYELF